MASVKVTATAAINGWRVTITLPGGAAVSNMWNGTHSGTTGTVTVTNMPYNGKLAAGQSTEFGFQGTGSAAGATVTCTAVDRNDRRRLGRRRGPHRAAAFARTRRSF
ncbi:cellulose binding domain-containing protein [Luedemannella flava]